MDIKVILMSTEYVNIKIPEKFAKDAIDPFVTPEQGYTSRAHFVTEAVREYSKSLKKDPKQNLGVPSQ